MASRCPDKFKVVRKASPNEKLSLYLFQRDYYDNATAPPVVDGVVMIDPNYATGSGRQVYVQMQLTFGRKGDPSKEDDFEHQFATKNLSLECQQVFPVQKKIEPIKMQEELCTKLGEHAYPFRLEFPKLGGPSYQMMVGSRDEQSNLGLEYEVMAFVGADEFDEHKRSTAHMAVWRIQCLPPNFELNGPKPKGHRNKPFGMMSGVVEINAHIDKALYKTDEEIKVFVEVNNTCNKPITNVKIKLCQRNQIPMFSDDGAADVTIQKVEDKVTIQQGGKLARDYSLVTTIPKRTSDASRWKYGQAMLEGTIGRDGKEMLAASTHINHSLQKRDLYGIYVEYIVKIKVTFGQIPGEAVCEVPFVLTQKEDTKKDA